MPGIPHPHFAESLLTEASDKPFDQLEDNLLVN